MKLKFDKEVLASILTYVVSGALIVLFFFLCKNFGIILSSFSKLIKIVMPFIFGFCISFLIYPIVKYTEKTLLKNLSIKDRTKRVISVFCGVLVMLVIIAGFFAILIPQLYSSGSALIKVLPDYLEVAEKFTIEFLGIGMLDNFLDTILEYSNSYITLLFSNLSVFLNYSYDFLVGVGSLLVGIIIAVYMLLDEERFLKQIEKIMTALFSEKVNNTLADITNLTGKMFNLFIFGKALDSLIIGIICFIVLALARYPYALLFSFIVGITNMIPVFGPFIGAVPCIFILLIIDPIKAAWFSLFILILQQIDGNIIGPYILGDSMGLPSLWIMFAIIVGGGLFGIIGMFIGVPVFSVIYILAKRYIDLILVKKNINV